MAVDASNSAPTSDDVAGQEPSQPKESAGRSFFGRLVAPFRAVDDPASEVATRSRGDEGSDDEGDEGASGDKPEGGEQPKQDEGEQKPYAVYVTKEDHDRAVQSEVDRRDAVRLQRQRNEERLRLRKEDPEAFISLEDQEKAAQEAATGIASKVIDVYDTEILTPLLARLPDEKRAEIAATINSVDSRKAAAEAVLKHIEDDAFKRGQEEGEKKANAKLRQNPAVRKELLVELRGDQDGLDNVEGAGSSTPVSTNAAVNNWLRQSVHAA